MEPLNYSRQMRKYFDLAIKYDDDLNQNSRIKENTVLCFNLSVTSEKFILPINGILLFDEGLKSLEEDMLLNLPYQRISLEYLYEDNTGDPIKTIIFAEQKEEQIECICAFGMQEKYIAGEKFFIDRNRYIKRDEDGNTSFIFKKNNTDIFAEGKHNQVLLMFLNVLQCSNVYKEKITARKQNKNKKDALPFDDYWILKTEIFNRKPGNDLGGTHRSPREHLRRGHIRRYASGLKIWINSTVINLHVGGIIEKDYALT